MRRKRKGRSASGELDGPMAPPKPTIFEEVDEVEGLDEFEPVQTGEPKVEWDDEEEHEMAEERFEALLEELFSDTDEDLGFFEAVEDDLSWSEGEVIWEGMDFDQMFTDSEEFHNFELLSPRDQKRFLRDRLRTQQISDAAEATDGEIDMEQGRKDKAIKPKPNRPEEPRSPGSLVSYDTETEHRPEELDLGLAPGKRKRRRGR